MTVDLSSYKVAASELSSSTKFDNLVQAVQDALNALPPSQITGYPSDVAKYLRGDGSWAGAWTSFVPVWSSDGTLPVLGNGTITGKYIQIGKAVFFEIILSMGTTTTFGTGNYRLSLPVTAAVTVIPAGTIYATDASAGAIYNGFAALASSALMFGYTSASPSALLTPTSPFTWAQSDSWQVMGHYEAA